MSEFSSLRDMSTGLAKGDFSSVELTQEHLTRIQKTIRTLTVLQP